MQQDSHYYAVLALCRTCGFNKTSAHEIAFASQYVDDAKVNHIKISGSYPPGVQPRDIAGCPSFFNMATCHYYDRANTFNFEAMLFNTSAFHFPPGAEGESFVHKMKCINGSESKVLQRLVPEVLDQGRITLGVFLHVYADSFSHQGFSGLVSKVNRVQGLKWKRNWFKPASWKPLLAVRLASHIRIFDRIVARLVPAYGHVQAYDLPDLPCAVWQYQYDDSPDFALEWKTPPAEVRNSERYRDAFLGMQDILERYLAKHPEERDPNPPKDDFGKLFSILTSNQNALWMRKRKWKKFLKDGLFDKDDEALKYSKNAWLQDAFSNCENEKKKFDRRKVDCAVLADGFLDSAWYRFYLAVNWYKKRLCVHCEDLGLVIPGSTVPPFSLAA